VIEFNPLNEWEKVALMQATLDWCNERRAEMDKEPLELLPEGEPSDPKSCPCGAATGLHVDAEVYELPEGQVTFDENGTIHWVEALPELVKVFIEHFDAMHIPELVAHSYSESMVPGAEF